MRDVLMVVLLFLLSAQSLKIYNYLFPSLELITAKSERCTHKIVRFIGRNKVVAIKNLGLVGENDMIPCRCAECLLYPCLNIRQERVVVRWSWCHKIDLVVVE